ncbi:MAG: hypothetical protein K1X89_27680, partial [Myxococcaceae bacterium]|nr:hypothetical protein [Myxococcaceae bacterium]
MNALLFAAALALAQTPENPMPPEAVGLPTPATAEVATPAPAPEPIRDRDMFPPWSCDQARAEAKLDGPVALGSFEADLATGRRVCPRTEIGLGGRFAAIIDTPNFYGNLGIDGDLFGSYALTPSTELFGHLEAVQFTYVQNASLKGTSLTLGHMTAGVTHTFDADREAHLRHGVSARVLLPTSFGIPGVHLVGAEVGHVGSWRAPRSWRWLEVHSYLGANLTAGLGAGPALPFATGTLVLGAQLSPFDWAA